MDTASGAQRAAGHFTKEKRRRRKGEKSKREGAEEEGGEGWKETEHVRIPMLF